MYILDWNTTQSDEGGLCLKQRKQNYSIECISNNANLSSNSVLLDAILNNCTRNLATTYWLHLICKMEELLCIVPEILPHLAYHISHTQLPVTFSSPLSGLWQLKLQPTYDFLLIFHCHCISILYHFKVITICLRKPKRRRVTFWEGLIMHMLALTTLHLYAACESTSFICSKDCQGDRKLTKSDDLG